MSDDLVKRLRDLCSCNIDSTPCAAEEDCRDAYAAADRIEELEAKLAACEKYRDAYAEMGRIGTEAVRDLEAKLAKANANHEHFEREWYLAKDRIEELEAKLAKAVEALELIDDIEIANTTLAELKGGKANDL